MSPSTNLQDRRFRSAAAPAVPANPQAKLRRQLDRLSRFELVEQCEEIGMRHAGRSDEDLRTALTVALLSPTGRSGKGDDSAS